MTDEREPPYRLGPMEPWKLRDADTLVAWTEPGYGAPIGPSWWLRLKRRIAQRVMDWADWEYDE